MYKYYNNCVTSYFWNLPPDCA